MEMMEQPHNIRDLVMIVYRQKRVFLAVFLLCVLTAGVVVLRTPDRYTSNAKLLVKEGRENVEVIPSAGTQIVTRGVNRSQSISIEMEIMRNRDLFAALVDSIGLDRFARKSALSEFFSPWHVRSVLGIGDSTVAAPVEPKPLSPAERALASDIRVNILMADVLIENSPESDIITVKYTSGSPELANAVVATLIGLYQEKHFQVHYAENSTRFFQDQLGTSRERLAAIEKQLAEANNRGGVSSPLESRALLLSRIELFSQQIDQNQSLIAETKSRVEGLKQVLSRQEAPAVSSSTVNQALQGELDDLMSRERDLRMKYVDGAEPIRDVRERIAQLLATGMADTAVVATADLSDRLQEDLINNQVTLAALITKQDDLRLQVASLQRELALLNIRQLDAAELERERDIETANFLKYSDTYEEARIDEVVQKERISNITVLEPATYPLNPDENQKMRNLGMGLFLGLFGGIAAAFFFDYLNHTIRTRDDVLRKLNVATLAAVPDFTQKRLRA